MAKWHSLVSQPVVHPIVQLSYPDATDRAAGTNETNGKVAGVKNINGVAQQLDTGSYWILESIGPLVWRSLLVGTATALTPTSVLFAGAAGEVTDDGANFVYTSGVLQVAELKGGVGSGDDLTLKGTSHATPGTLFLNPLGGLTTVGTAGGGSHSLGSGDTYFGGVVEIDAKAYLDGGFEVSTTSKMLNNVSISLGTAGLAALRFSSSQTLGAPMIVMDPVSNVVLFSCFANRNFNFAHTAKAHPTLFWHSSTASVANEYVGKQHNTVDAKDIIGKGSQVVEHIAPVELADDASFDLPDATAGRGWFLVGDSEEQATIAWDSTGFVDLIDWSANVIDTDTDTYFCIFDNGTSVRVRNRLGTAKKVMFQCNYWTP